MLQPAQQLEILVVTRTPLPQHLHTTLLFAARRVMLVPDPQMLMRHLWERVPDLLLILSAQPEHADVPLICEQVRSFYQLPLLVLEHGASEEQRIAWLDAGADDVLSISSGVPAELPSRCRALVQRARRQQRRDPSSHYLHALGMQLDIVGRRLYVAQGQPVNLTDNLTRCLAICFVYGEALVPAEVLGDHIFGKRPSDLRQRLAALAQKLQECTATLPGPRPCLELVRGLGYRLTIIPPSAPEAPPTTSLTAHP